MRYLANVLIFGLTLAAFSYGLDVLLPWPELGDLSAKFAYFEAHRAAYDAVFIGSSRIYRQLSPALFDRTVRDVSGRSLHSFNFGIPALYLPESLYVIDRLRRLPGPRPRWLFIELSEPPLSTDRGAPLTQREIYWHGPVETALMLAQIGAHPDISAWERLALSCRQVALCGRRFLHLGRGQDLLSRYLNRRKLQPQEAAWTGARSIGALNAGYSPYKYTIGQVARGSDDGGHDAHWYQRAIAALVQAQATVPAPGSLWPEALQGRLLAREAAALRRSGIEPLFLIPPVNTETSVFDHLAARGVLKPCYAYNRPLAYPMLYTVDVHADAAHLNERGAELWTRLFATQFAARN